MIDSVKRSWCIQKEKHKNTVPFFSFFYAYEAFLSVHKHKNLYHAYF